MATVFFSYAHRDEALRDQLEVHLAMLKRQGAIEAWHDRQIAPGRDLNNEISAALEAAEVILLLVSPDFLASDYCYGVEMTRALERQRAGQAVVVPIILRPCAWRDALFKDLLAAPRDGKPVTTWTNLDEAFVDVVNAIKRALASLGSAAPASPRTGGITAVRVAAAGSSGKPRSSNLRVTKRFTDEDKDQFLHEGFDYITRVFANSIEELARRNPGVTGRVRPIDATRFTAAVYRDGNAACRCTVYYGGRGHFSGGIAYLEKEEPTASGSFNESLSVEADGQALYFKPMGMAFHGHADSNAKLSFEGAAEYLWGIFIAPLQR